MFVFIFIVSRCSSPVVWLGWGRLMRLPRSRVSTVPKSAYHQNRNTFFVTGSPTRKNRRQKFVWQKKNTVWLTEFRTRFEKSSVESFRNAANKTPLRYEAKRSCRRGRVSTFSLGMHSTFGDSGDARCKRSRVVFAAPHRSISQYS